MKITIEELEQFHKKVCDRARAKMIERGKQYDEPGRALETFKLTANLTNRERADVAFVDAAQKFARVIMSMRKGELPEDSVIDGINYFIDTLFFLTKQQQYIDKVKSVE